ncbi:MAG: (Uracil-5)-methyltransferase [Parcubacteria group bacterium GW2011_GWC1_41_7]|nr:MAG: (Uracil-5)-methyltransferase [Parcubacteria group bacterium GW2011_GWC1_41_7]
MNDAAQAILAILQEKNITLDDLKTLILRESKSKKTCIAILYVKNKQAGETLKNVSHFLLGINGFLVIYSNPLSPASKTTAVLHVSGDNFLEEVIKNRTIKYGFDSFFQNNMPVFENALEIIQKETAGAQCIADLYCGAGTIGICLAEKNQRMIGVEIDEHAALRAKENALSNNIVPYEAYELSAEKTEKEILQKADVIIVDPPRSGLHPKLTKTILECTPKKIIYLSCNPKTQHDDMLLLLQNYTPIKLYGFDFYPQTPHMESLLICFKK